MKERFRELAEEAGLEYNFDPMLWLKYEKFTELIVRECVEVVKWTPSLFPNDEYVKNIKEHFGVGE